MPTSPFSDNFQIKENVSLSSFGLRLHRCSHRGLGNIGITYRMKEKKIERDRKLIRQFCDISEIDESGELQEV